MYTNNLFSITREALEATMRLFSSRTKYYGCTPYGVSVVVEGDHLRIETGCPGKTGFYVSLSSKFSADQSTWVVEVRAKSSNDRWGSFENYEVSSEGAIMYTGRYNPNTEYEVKTRRPVDRLYGEE